MRPDINRHARRSFARFGLAILFALTVLAGCGGPSQTYVPPDGLTLSGAERKEYVNLFLQGRWCMAKSAFEASTSNYLAADDFCAAASNYILAHNLKAQIGQAAPDELTRAKDLARLGGGCPALTPLFACSEGPCDPAFQPADADYRKLLDKRDFKGLASRAASDKDPYYGSVYARKGAALALSLDDRKSFASLFEAARRIDARQGWLVFVRADWRLAAQAESDPERRQAIAERVKVLDGLIQPCD